MNTIKITFNDGTTEEYPIGISLLELSKYYQTKMKNPILGAKINNVFKPLSDKLMSDSEIEFIDFNDIDGNVIYKSGVKFLLLCAVKELYGETADVYFYNSLDKGVYSKLINVDNISENTIKEIKNKMQEIVNLDLPIVRYNIKKRDAVNYLYSIKENEKARNVQFASNPTVTMYKLKNFFNYFYTDMPDSTKKINNFDISYIEKNELVLRFPIIRSNNEIPEYIHHPNTLKNYRGYRYWLDIIKVPYVADLNDIVADNKIKDFIMMNYIITENHLFEIAKKLMQKNSKNKVKGVFISGPSSSGKTTSARKLAIELKSFGLSPIIISLDNYFKERTETPRDETGKYDYEGITALDLDLFRDQITKLLNGESVIIPEYNFFSGSKEYRGKKLELEDNSILIFEGLHALNDEITKCIKEEEQFKIYISPFIALNIDRHNYISSVDLRLIRRIVRDNFSRGYSVTQTIENWQSVRKGEEKFVFPYQDKADEILNTALIYEVGVLRVYAEPLLSSVSVSSRYYEEARRLLGFLRGFFPITSEYISKDSVIREFIGGSMYN